MNPKEVRARLQDLAKHISSVVGKETAFALLVFAQEPDGSQRCEYVSNGKREVVWQAIAEWVVNTSEKPLGDS